MSFVSGRDLEAAREQRKKDVKEMRDEVLREARESFEREKKREELKRARGDDTWIVPAVKKRLGFKGATGHSSEKKKGKKKKDKKPKKPKESSNSEKKGSESDSGESEREAMWIEKETSTRPETETLTPSDAGPQAPAKLQREDWMTMPLGPSDRALSLLSLRGQESEKERQKQADMEKVKNFLDEPGQHPRELNPFWKGGGLGLPSSAQETSPTHTPASKPKSRRSEKSLGDGGHSWLLRAYKRALEEAQQGDQTLEDIATERWGSLEKLYSLLGAAGIDPDDPDRPPRGRGKREYLYSRARRLDEGADRRSVEEFDRRRGRDGGRGERESVRRGREEGGRRERERYEEERRGSYDSHSRRRDFENRKRDWKQGFQKLPPKSDRDSSSEFLKPGDLDQGAHSRSTGIRAGLTGGTPSSRQGWRKKEPRTTSDDHARETEDKADPTNIEQPSQSEFTDDQPPFPASQESSGADEVVIESAVAVPEDPVTEAQLNSLGAKLMKAELMGNQEKVEKLKSELQKLREVRKLQESSGDKHQSGPSVGKREEKTLVLTKTDRFGREKPVQAPSTSLGYRPPPKRATTHTKKGKREKYFHDDDRYSLRELVEQERMMTAEETHAAIARMASKFTPATGSDETVDDVIDSKSAMKYDEAKELDKAKKRSIAESRKMADAVDRCQLCFDSSHFNKHLLIAVGMNTYLCAPWHTSLTEGHCYIVPMEHTTCSLFLDENVWSEVEIFRKGLTRMFTNHDLDVVFMETFTSVKRKTHMYIDCIPIPREEGELAPMYFKKAILESDEEWAQNKKLIDTREKGVQGSLPTGLPYFFAEFGLDGGFGHVIEDTDQFPHYFGREVVGGLLDLSPRLWLKPHREDFDKQKEKVTKLSEWWAPYDWTQKLKTE